MEYTETGGLIVNVRTAGGSLGVEGARVTVSSMNEDGTRTLIRTMETDSSGAAPRIELPAPPRQNTMSPDETGATSSRYFVTTDKEGYYSVANDFIPIYSGITSIQNVELIPLPFGSTYENSDGDMVYDENSSPDL